MALNKREQWLAAMPADNKGASKADERQESEDSDSKARTSNALLSKRTAL